MRHLLVLSCVLAACGTAREDFHAAQKAEAEARARVEARPEVVAEPSEDSEPDVTDAAGRAYLAKLTATGDTACKCNSEECGKSVMESWMLSVMASNHTLSAADRTREEQLLQRLFTCATLSAPEKKSDVARVKAESKAARAKVLARLDDTYEGESDATRTAIRALRRDVRELCACTTMACVERLQSRFSDPPVVTSKREVDVVTELLAGVMTCGSYVVANESLAVIE